ncbi:MAG: ROK family protein [Victivallaceae bacterium]|jgi:predicted NBD/HSP70 family sugar kinase
MSKKIDIRQEILKCLCSSGQMTRTDFVRQTGIRPATVFEVVDELKQDGIISELERKGKKTGRVSPAITFNMDYLWLLGIDFQFKKTIGVITDLNGKVIASAEAPGLSRKGLEDCRNEIRTVVTALKNQVGVDWKIVAGAGFSDPGIVDIEHGISLKAVNLQGWENFNSGTWLREMTGLRHALILPETIVGTYMEYYSRFPQPPESLFHMEMGTGIGGGFVKDGTLFIGGNSRGMEIGHIVIMPEGPLCRCGNRGCLEAIAGEAGLKRRVAELINNGVNTALKTENFTIAAFCELAGRDKAARMLAYDISSKISNALATVVTLLNPSMIVLSGELAGLGNILTDTIKRELPLRCMPGAADNLAIEISALDEYATARGAALMLREKILLQQTDDDSGRN